MDNAGTDDAKSELEDTIDTRPRCALCNTILLPGWRTKPVGKHKVCWDCRDSYPLARVLQLEAALAAMTVRLRGAGADLARLALYTKPKDA